jgi:hypothetical protein
MEKTPFEQWADGRFNLSGNRLELQGIAWCAALHWAKTEILKKHRPDNPKFPLSPQVKDIITTIEKGMK